MSPYRRKGQSTWTITIATGDPARPWARLSTGTRDRASADQMQKMMDLFGERGKRMFWVRDAVVARRVHVGEVYDAYVSNQLDALRAALEDVELALLFAPWEAAVQTSVADGTLAAETARKYVAQVRTLVGESLRRSQLTGPWLKARLEAVPGSGTNRRRHAAAWIHFLDYAVEAGQLAVNPLRQLKLPKANRTRDRYAEWPHVLRLLHAFADPMHRALAAVRHGAGLEMQAALAMTRRDVDLATQVVWAHGAKNAHRDRQAIVLDATCWELFAGYVRAGGFLPDASLFPVTADVHRDAQAAALRVLEAEGVAIRAGYTLHAARHSFAVEMSRRGHEAKLIATNLGHANETMVIKLYGKYRPRAEDLVRAAKRAGGGA